MATVEGSINEVRNNVDTGWYEIKVDGFGKSLRTKRDELAQLAAKLKRSGTIALVEYTHKPRTDEATGRVYDNYYFENATPVEEPTASDDGIERVSTPSRKTDPGDAWRITLSAGAKLAVATLPLMPNEQRTFETQKRIAEAWAEWIYFSRPPEAPELDGAGDDPYGDPLPNEDDIPF